VKLIKAIAGIDSLLHSDSVINAGDNDRVHDLACFGGGVRAPNYLSLSFSLARALVISRVMHYISTLYLDLQQLISPERRLTMLDKYGRIVDISGVGLAWCV